MIATPWYIRACADTCFFLSSFESDCSGSATCVVVCLKTGGLEDITIGSGGNKLSLRCCRCSPSRHATGIQKQNLTDQEKGVVSSLSVCERPDFFKTRWWTKNFFWWKLAQGPSQHLDRNKKLHTAFSFCTSILTAHQVDYLPTNSFSGHIPNVQRGWSSS